MTISEYHRPQTMEKALALLGRREPVTVPLGGGTKIDLKEESNLAVVDLQALGLDRIEQEGSRIKTGARVTLGKMLAEPIVSSELASAIRIETSANQLQMATLAGRLVAADGRSPLATILLAMDGEMTWEPGNRKIRLGDWLPMRKAIKAGASQRPGLIITSITWPAKMMVSFQHVARTPMDKILVCVCVAGWSSGRRRIAIGGFGQEPFIVMDGPDPAGAEEAVRDALSQSGDEWASAEYRQEMAVILTQRSLQELSEKLVDKDE